MLHHIIGYFFKSKSDLEYEGGQHEICRNTDYSRTSVLSKNYSHYLLIVRHMGGSSLSITNPYIKGFLCVPLLIVISEGNALKCHLSGNCLLSENKYANVATEVLF